MIIPNGAAAIDAVDGVSSLGSGFVPVSSPDSVRGFEEALERYAAVSGPAGASMSDVSRASGAVPVSAGSEVPVVGSAPAPAGGDLILQGVQALRGIFDERETRVGGILAKGGVDASSLLAMQTSLTEFTLLIDVASKLTGKTTQVFDTLMKGQ